MSEKNKLAFLIGAPKTGTTAVAHWLDRHSEIFTLPSKEPGFFRSKTDRFVINGHHPDRFDTIAPDGPMRNEAAYRALASEAVPGQWLLDGSTDYLSDDGAPDRIKAYADGGEVRIICSLRDPIERAYSEYSHTRRDGFEPLSFRGSLDAEEDRIAAEYQPLFFHLRRSRYHADLSRFIDVFGEGRVLILDHNELKTDPDKLAEKVIAFLGVGQEALGQPAQLNVSRPEPVAPAGLMSQAKQAVKKMIRPDVDRSVEPLSDADRRYVFERLEQDIRACIEDERFPTARWSCQAML